MLRGRVQALLVRVDEALGVLFPPLSTSSSTRRRLPPPPGLAFATASAPGALTPPATPPLGAYSMQQLVADLRVLWGVPKYRTSKPKKQTRKFSYTRLMSLFDNLTTCETCGEQHEQHTICGKCYEQVREETNAIKEKMMAYNPYKGELPPKHIQVRYEDDAAAETAAEGEKGASAGASKNDAHVIERERPRPSWFRRDLSNSVR